MLLALIIASYLKTKSINLLQIWISGYIFIIWSECMIMTDEGNGEFYINQILFFSLANLIVISSYLIFQGKKFKRDSSSRVFIRKKYFFVLLVVCLLIYIYNSIPEIKLIMIKGRQLKNVLGSTTLSGFLISSLGVVLPAVIGYYFKQRKKGFWFGLLLVFPIIIVQFLGGTRFKLLFAILPYFITSGLLTLNRLPLKKIIVTFCCIGILASASAFLKENRSKTNFLSSNSVEILEKQEDKQLLREFADEMSPEGCVQMAWYADDYFSSHSLRYGLETTFWFYFWVPRSIWESKPTPIDNWLIRKYEAVAPEFSTASGFLGEIRADFGALSLLICILFGWLLRSADNYIITNLHCSNIAFNGIIASLMFPYVFFFIRSPLTATQTLLPELALVFIIRYFFTIKSSNYIK